MVVGAPRALHSVLSVSHLAKPNAQNATQQKNRLSSFNQIQIMQESENANLIATQNM